MLVVNCYGGPGVGKSVLSAEIFTALKKAGINAELCGEAARDLIYEESYRSLENQIYVFGQQHHRLWRLRNKVQVALMDSPLLLTIPYDSTKSESFKSFVYQQYLTFDNLDIVVRRRPEYHTMDGGRIHGLEESIEIDKDITDLLDSFSIKWIWASPGEVEEIVLQIKQRLN